MFETSLLFDKVTDQGDKPDWFWGRVKTVAIIALLALGIACTAWGTWLFFSPHHLNAHSSDIPLLSLEPTASIYVDVAGAVESPGIYPLPEGERIAAALEAAGGLSTDADTEYVTTTLNLSARLKDEQKIYVPTTYERQASELEGALVSNQNLESAQSSNDLLSINSATESQLDELPKIGPATAQKIIDGRPYTSINDLLTQKIVGEAVFDEIKELIKI